MLAAGFHPISGYRLTEQLGLGQAGEVWKAVREDGGTAALKFLDCRTRPSAEIAAEVQALRALAGKKHPHIIELRKIHATSHYLVLEMELADGNLRDLHQAYQRKFSRNVPPEQVLELLGQAAQALDDLAETKLPGSGLASRQAQHCNVKPSNILLVGEVAKVADFGLASGTVGGPRGLWRGAPPYAAPELMRGQPCQGTDQYALAVLFCELVAGARLFLDASPLDGPDTPPVDLTKARENEFPIISRALHRHASARYPSCRDFLAALKAVAKLPRSSRTIRKVTRVPAREGTDQDYLVKTRSPAEIARRLRELRAGRDPSEAGVS